VGHGRNSIVYRAKLVQKSVLRYSGRQREVALKVLTSNPKDREKNVSAVRHEALAMLCSQHPNVIRLHDYIANEELCYLAMEYAERGDLRRELARSGGALPPRIVLHLLNQILSGLEAIHGAGIIHRDIKPENILVTSAGSVRLADFGIAQLPSTKVSSDDKERGVGTFDYLAPELLEEGESNFQTDIYAVGVTAYELMTGTVPFGGETLTQQINNKLSGTRLSLEQAMGYEVPLLDALIEKAVAAKPRDRFKSVAEFRNVVRHLCDKHWDERGPVSKRAERAIIEQVGRPKSTLLIEKSTFEELQGTGLVRKNKLLRKLRMNRLAKRIEKEEERTRENIQLGELPVTVSESSFNTKPQLIARVTAISKSGSE